MARWPSPPQQFPVLEGHVLSLFQGQLTFQLQGRNCRMCRRVTQQQITEVPPLSGCASAILKYPLKKKKKSLSCLYLVLEELYFKLFEIPTRNFECTCIQYQLYNVNVSASLKQSKSSIGLGSSKRQGCNLTLFTTFFARITSSKYS